PYGSGDRRPLLTSDSYALHYCDCNVLRKDLWALDYRISNILRTALSLPTARPRSVTRLPSYASRSAGTGQMRFEERGRSSARLPWHPRPTVVPLPPLPAPARPRS